MAPRIVTFLVLAGLAVVAGCGSTAPSPPSTREPAATGVALACLSVEPPECADVYRSAVTLLPPGHPPVVAAQVAAWSCEAGPCPPGFGRRGAGRAVVEFEDGGGLVSWQLTADPAGSVAVGPASAEAIGAFEPESPPAGGPVAAFSLGHCGLDSPIDFDGSFWDPVGPVDGDAAEAINSASGTITLLAPDLAEFRAPSGFVVRLQRHEGRKSLFGCD